MIYLDTHVVVWLNVGRSGEIPESVRLLIEQEDVLISPMVELELEYLFEIGRAAKPARQIISRLGQMVGLRICQESFAEVIESAAQLDWTRDPFDRIIVGHAALRQRPLVTKDRLIRKHYPHAHWSDGA